MYCLLTVELSSFIRKPFLVNVSSTWSLAFLFFMQGSTVFYILVFISTQFIVIIIGLTFTIESSHCK